MKKIVIIVLILIIVAFGWWASRPLFFDDVVDEPLPVVREEPLPASINMEREEFEAISDENKMRMEREIVERMMEEPDSVMEEPMPDETDALEKVKEGNFEGADDFHEGSGLASIYRQSNGTYVLRFEEFSVINGPDLRVYLAKNQDPDGSQVAKGVELASLKGNKGNQNYVLPDEVDPADYQSVVIYCKPFKVIFATANLNPISADNNEED